MNGSGYDVGSSFSGPVAEALEHSPLGNLPRSLVSRLLAHSIQVELPPNRTLYEAGTEPFLALVIAGVIRLYLFSPEGRQVTVHYARDGAVVGLDRLADEPSCLFADTATSCRLLRLPVDWVAAAARSDPKVAANFVTAVGRLLNAVVFALGETTFATVRQRLARHLLELAVPRADVKSTRAIVELTHQQLADAVGSVREVVSRQLRELEDAGLIRTTPQGVAVVDAQALQVLTWPGQYQ